VRPLERICYIVKLQTLEFPCSWNTHHLLAHTEFGNLQGDFNGMKLDAVKFGLAGGIISALFMFVLALGSAFAGWGTGMLDSIATMYVGYKAGFVGGLIGATWAFVEGFVSFYLIAWVYDYLQKEKQA